MAEVIHKITFGLPAAFITLNYRARNPQRRRQLRSPRALDDGHRGLGGLGMIGFGLRRRKALGG